MSKSIDIVVIGGHLSPRPFPSSVLLTSWWSESTGKSYKGHMGVMAGGSLYSVQLGSGRLTTLTSKLTADMEDIVRFRNRSDSYFPMLTSYAQSKWRMLTPDMNDY